MSINCNLCRERIGEKVFRYVFDGCNLFLEEATVVSVSTCVMLARGNEKPWRPSTDEWHRSIWDAAEAFRNAAESVMCEAMN